MTTNRTGGGARGHRWIAGIVRPHASTALLAIGLLAAPVAGALAAGTPEGALSDEDAKCLKCHSRNLSKPLEDGAKLSLHVNPEAFAESVHSRIGCGGCHRDVAKAKHPSREPIANAREYAIAQNEICGKCHSAMSEQYSGSIHASLVANGNPQAPLCSDCHSAHEVESTALYDPVTGLPCKRCHEDVYEAYSESVHGIARTEGNTVRAAHIQAPICADCHQAHDVSAVAATNGLQATCLSCHEGAAAAHADWLPNAKMHMTSVSCAACHSPAAERRIDLQLVDRLTEVPVGEAGAGELALREKLRRSEASGEVLTPVELWKLVRETSREGGVTEITLRGRMEVSSGADAHRLSLKASATRDCESCHEGGSESFENVTVSISTPAGQKQRFEADSKVLSSVVSVDSVRDFYAPGGTRIRLLDWLLILAVIGAMAIPVGHMALGAYLRRRNEAGATRQTQEPEKQDENH